MKKSVEHLQQLLVDSGYNLGTFGINKDGVDGDPGKLTRDAAFLWSKNRVEELGLRHCHNNLVELRMSDVFTDKFSDLCLVISVNKCVAIAEWTTKPGKYWINNPATVGGIFGTGIQAPGQTINSYKFMADGKTKWGEVGYFKVIKPIPVYRDGNKDNKLDKNVIQVAPASYGFQKHAMGSGYRIWNWSNGCTGAPKEVWISDIAPHFKNGQVISPIILEI